MSLRRVLHYACVASILVVTHASCKKRFRPNDVYTMRSELFNWPEDYPQVGDRLIIVLEEDGRTLLCKSCKCGTPLRELRCQPRTDGSYKVERGCHVPVRREDRDEKLYIPPMWLIPYARYQRQLAEQLEYSILTETELTLMSSLVMSSLSDVVPKNTHGVDPPQPKDAPAVNEPRYLVRGTGTTPPGTPRDTPPGTPRGPPQPLTEAQTRVYELADKLSDRQEEYRWFSPENHHAEVRAAYEEFTLALESLHVADGSEQARLWLGACPYIQDMIDNQPEPSIELTQPKEAPPKEASEDGAQLGDNDLGDTDAPSNI